jgi:hypothetical protein
LAADEFFDCCIFAALERDDFSSNRHPALSFCLSMISGYFAHRRLPAAPSTAGVQG